MATTQDVQIGSAVESTYGTPVTVTRFYEPTDESLKWNKNVVQGKGMRVASRVARSARRVVTRSDVTGDFSIELLTKGLGTLLQTCCGTGVSTLVAGTTFQQNFTLATSGSTLPAMTLQKGVVATDGTVYAHTFSGMTCSEFELTLDNSELGMLKTSWDGRSVATATALATASYTSGSNLFHWGQAVVTYGGTVTAPTTTALASGGTTVNNVRAFSVKVNNNLTTDRFNMGATGLKAQPTVGLREITGQLTIEYTDNTMRDAFIADTENPLTVTLTTTEALSTGFAQLQIVLPAIKLDGDLPDANGTDLITVDVPFTVLDNVTAAQPMWIVLRTADATL